MPVKILSNVIIVIVFVVKDHFSIVSHPYIFIFFIGDGFKGHNGIPFSTYDKDHDNLKTGSCSYEKGGGGGWWFNSCGNSNGNGRYYKFWNIRRDGITWGRNARGPMLWTSFRMIIKPA